jgi:TolA-binding protein
MKNYFLILLTATFCISEPSAFGADGSKNNKSYNLLKQEIKTIRQQNATLESKLEEQSQLINGIRDVVDGDFNKVVSELNKIKSDNKTKSKNKNIETKVKILSSNVSKMKRAIYKQNRNIARFKEIIMELTTLIDNINNTYAKKDDLDFLKNEVTVRLEEQRGTSLQKELLVGDQKYLFGKARVKFKNKSFDEAKIIFQELLDTNYKPATINYYLGEIHYYQKKYFLAIKFYKASVSLYSQSPFMPTLLLHSGISLEKTKNNKEAKSFFKSLTKNFPKSQSSILAKKHLRNLKQ